MQCDAVQSSLIITCFSHGIQQTRADVDELHVPSKYVTTSNPDPRNTQFSYTDCSVKLILRCFLHPYTYSHNFHKAVQLLHSAPNRLLLIDIKLQLTLSIQSTLNSKDKHIVLVSFSLTFILMEPYHFKSKVIWPKYVLFTGFVVARKATLRFIAIKDDLEL